MGELNVEPVKLEFKPNTNPIFLKARPVPFALRELVEAELNKLEKQGILVKVNHSEYATPIVPVMKANGKVRICGDYKVILNPQLLIDEYPWPTTNELFNNLAGGSKFSKIDFKCAMEGEGRRSKETHS